LLAPVEEMKRSLPVQTAPVMVFPVGVYTYSLTLIARSIPTRLCISDPRFSAAAVKDLMAVYRRWLSSSAFGNLQLRP